MKNRPLIKSFRNGFSLIEVIVYIALFSVIASTLVLLAISASGQNGTIVGQTIDAYGND